MNETNPELEQQRERESSQNNFATEFNIDLSTFDVDIDDHQIENEEELQEEYDEVGLEDQIPMIDYEDDIDKYPIEMMQEEEMEIEERPSMMETTPTAPQEQTVKQAIGHIIPQEFRLSREISGDFQKLAYPLRPLYMELIEEKVEEEKTLFVPLDISTMPISDLRDKLLKKCLALTRKKNAEKLRNAVLNSFLAKYFIRKKMNFCLKEFNRDINILHFKYTQKLEEYEALMKYKQQQQNILKNQLDKIVQLRDKKSEALQVLFDDFQNFKASIGRGLIYAKSGKEISNKLVDNLLFQHRTFITELASLRKNYIDLKSSVTQREEAINNMDRVEDSDFTLMYYEKLKFENRDHCDKIEEKDLELTVVRKCLQDAVQIISHVREKSFALIDDINYLKLSYQEAQAEVLYHRKQLNHIKAERDNYRTMSVTLKNEAGLLFQPTLLRDLEHEREQYSHLKKQLDQLKDESNLVIRQTRNARQMLETLNIKNEKLKLKRKGIRHKLKRKKMVSPLEVINLKKNEEHDFRPSVIKLEKKLTVN